MGGEHHGADRRPTAGGIASSPRHGASHFSEANVDNHPGVDEPDASEKDTKQTEH
jgi:hypothetical protein